MKRFSFLFIFSFLILHVNSFAQKQTPIADTNYIEILIDSCKELKGNGKINNALILGKETLSLIEQSLGNADEKTKRKLKLSKATLLRTLGNAYKDLFDLPNALENYQQCLKTAKEVDDKTNIAGALLNIGVVYQSMHEYEKALDYLNQSVKSFEEIGHKKGLALCFSNLGVVYSYLSEDSLSLAFYEESLKMYTDLNDKKSEADQLNNISAIYMKQKRYAEAKENYEFSLKMYEEIGDSADMATSLACIGNIYETSDKNLKKAEQFYVRALSLARKFNLGMTKQILNSLKELYHQQGRYKEAYEMYDQFILIKDSITKQENVDEILRREMKSDFTEKQAKLQAEKEKQEIIAEEKSNKQKIIIWSVAGGLLLVVVFSIFILNRWRVTQRQKVIIEKQKILVDEKNKLVEEKNKDITDSINYASRIQRALLTSDEYIGRHLKDYFILFKPKDIVSGDFYWAFSPIESSNKQRFYIACCDCTGHGVPGAFMSLLNISFLNEAVIEKNHRETDLLLNDVRKSVIKALNPDGSTETKDGMDTVLCEIDLKNNILHASCANNPLWIVQNGTVNEIEPDKMPVGLHSTMDSFKKNTVQLNKGDIIYLFSDGYADQFGGPKGKKFKYKQLEDVILANHHFPMKEQKNILEKTYDEWKGNLEQIDDVLVIGIRI